MKRSDIEKRFPLFKTENGILVNMDGYPKDDEICAEHNKAVEMIKKLAYALEKADKLAFDSIWGNGTVVDMREKLTPEKGMDKIASRLESMITCNTMSIDGINQSIGRLCQSMCELRGRVSDIEERKGMANETVDND